VRVRFALTAQKNLVNVDADSLPLPIEFITLARGAISFGSDIDMECNPTQRAFIGIGLVLFQLTSEWNWLSGGAPWQAADLDGNSNTMSCASEEVLIKVLEEYAKCCCSFVL
jgi:hypothetical protein